MSSMPNFTHLSGKNYLHKKPSVYQGAFFHLFLQGATRAIEAL